MTDEELLPTFKKSIGVLSSDTLLDEFYLAQLNIATADLITEDISEEVLYDTDIGQKTRIVYAQALLDGKDTATDPTLLFLRNKLNSITRGNAVKEIEND